MSKFSALKMIFFQFDFLSNMPFAEKNWAWKVNSENDISKKKHRFISHYCVIPYFCTIWKQSFKRSSLQ